MWMHTLKAQNTVPIIYVPICRWGENNEQKYHFNKCSSANSFHNIFIFCWMPPNANLLPCFMTLFYFPCVMNDINKQCAEKWRVAQGINLEKSECMARTHHWKSLQTHKFHIILQIKYGIFRIKRRMEFSQMYVSQKRFF